MRPARLSEMDRFAKSVRAPRPAAGREATPDPTPPSGRTPPAGSVAGRVPPPCRKSDTAPPVTVPDRFPRTTGGKRTRATGAAPGTEIQEALQLPGGRTCDGTRAGPGSTANSRPWTSGSAPCWACANSRPGTRAPWTRWTIDRWRGTAHRWGGAARRHGSAAHGRGATHRWTRTTHAPAPTAAPTTAATSDHFTMRYEKYQER